jgi:hypothetical protein
LKQSAAFLFSLLFRLIIGLMNNDANLETRFWVCKLLF